MSRTETAYIPAGWKREQSMAENDWLKAGSICIESDKYDVRTKAVVKACQVCIVISPDIASSPGTALTVRLAKDEGMQLWIFHNVPDRAKWKAEAHAMAYWLVQLEKYSYKGMSVMVAGPREGKWKGAEDASLTIMMHALKEYKGLK